MTLKVARLPLAEGTADRDLRELGVSSLPVDLIRIAKLKGITVQAAPSHMNGFSKMLAQWDTNFGIMYSTHIENDGFWKVQHRPRTRTLPLVKRHRPFLQSAHRNQTNTGLRRDA